MRRLGDKIARKLTMLLQIFYFGVAYPSLKAYFYDHPVWKSRSIDLQRALYTPASLTPQSLYLLYMFKTCFVLNMFRLESC